MVEVLTDSANLTDYPKKMRKRDVGIGSYMGTNCTPVAKLRHIGVGYRSNSFSFPQNVVYHLPVGIVHLFLLIVDVYCRSRIAE
jgi:hypothetical protein